MTDIKLIRDDSANAEPYCGTRPHAYRDVCETFVGLTEDKPVLLPNGYSVYLYSDGEICLLNPIRTQGTLYSSWIQFAAGYLRMFW